MGSAVGATVGLLHFLSDVRARGAETALRDVNLAELAGRPLEEIFLALVEVVCLDGGTIDDGIARDAFVEMIAELADLNITDLDHLTVEQMATLLESYATHAIEGRLCNDIGMNVVRLPKDLRAVRQVERALHDFIRGAVSDAIEKVRSSLGNVSRGDARRIVERAYQEAFAILIALADEDEEGDA